MFISTITGVKWLCSGVGAKVRTVSIGRHSGESMHGKEVGRDLGECVVGWEGKRETAKWKGEGGEEGKHGRSD